VTRKDSLKALASLLDTEPKRFALNIVVVNPSGGGSWIAGTDLAGIRIFGSPADTAADATRNLFDKLTATRGYREDGEIQVALEMAVAGQGAADLFASAGKELESSDSGSDGD
jgi:hypothetical protein